MFLAIADGPFRTGLHAFGAKQAPPQVEPEAGVVNGDGVRRACCGTGTATVGALGGVYDWQAAEAVRQGRNLSRVGDCPVALLQTSERNSQHTVTSQIVPAIA